MKFLVCSDIHIGAKNKDIDVTKNILDVFCHFVEKAIEVNPDYILIGGDVFDTNNPLPEEYSFFIECLNRIINKTKSHVFIIVGNHDEIHSIERGNALSPIASINFERINVISEIKTISLKDNIELLCIPYISESKVHLHDYDGEKRLIDFYEKKLKTVEKELDKDKFNIVLSHLDIANVKYSEEFIPKHIRAKMPDVILNSDKINLGINGHIHQYQILKKTDENKRPYPFIICGSLSQIKFHKNPDKKYFLQFDVG